VIFLGGAIALALLGLIDLFIGLFVDSDYLSWGFTWRLAGGLLAVAHVASVMA